MKKIILASLCTLTAVNPMVAFNWQKAKKYVKPTLKTTAALGCFAAAYGTYCLTRASTELFNDAANVANKHNNSATALTLGMAGTIIGLAVGIPSVVAAISTSILGGWLVKSAYDDVTKADNEQ